MAMADAPGAAPDGARARKDDALAGLKARRRESRRRGDGGRAGDPTWPEAKAGAAGGTPAAAVLYPWPAPRRTASVVVAPSCVGAATAASAVRPEDRAITLRRPRTNLARTLDQWDSVHHSTGDDGLFEHAESALADALRNGEHLSVILHGARATEAAEAIAARIPGAVFAFLEDARRANAIVDAAVHVTGLVSAVLAPARAPVTGRSVSREVLLDLLQDPDAVARIAGGTATAGLTVREHRREGFFAENAAATPVADASELRAALDAFWARRRAAAKTCAEKAAARAAAAPKKQAALAPKTGDAAALAPMRCHAALLISVRTRRKDGAEAWSEVAIADPTLPEDRRGATEDPVLKAMWRVFDNLSAPGSQRHVAWRDSKWTRVLKAGLGGGGALVLIPRVLIVDDNAFEASAAVLDTCAKLCGVSVEVDKRVLHYEQAAAEHLDEALKLGRTLGMDDASVRGLRPESLELDMEADERLVAMREHLAERGRLLAEGKRWLAATSPAC